MKLSEVLANIEGLQIKGNLEVELHKEFLKKVKEIKKRRVKNELKEEKGI